MKNKIFLFIAYEQYDLNSGKDICEKTTAVKYGTSNSAMKHKRFHLCLVVSYIDHSSF